jgi:long-chain fatty acid transport protein
MRGKHLCSLLGAAVTAIGLSAPAGAAGFSVREQSAEGQGASFAGVAAGTDGLSSMYWNPAAAILHDGFTVEGNGSLILPSSRAEDGTSPAVPLAGFGDSGNIGVTAAVPAAYASYRLNEMLALGLSINAPFGLSTDARGNWVGAPHGNLSEIATYNFGPMAAIRLSDEIALGAGLQIEFMDTRLTSNRPVTGASIADIEGHDWGFGFTGGILFTPLDSTAIGLGFRSSVEHSLKGDGGISTPLGIARFDAEAPFDTPEIVTLGIRHAFNDRLTLLGGAEWTNWSRFEELRINNAATGAAVSIVDEDWDDSWFFSAGGEYAVNDALTLRTGVAYENSGVPGATRTPRVPDNDRYWVSVGASMRLADWITAHAGYSHVFVEDAGVNLAGGESVPANIPLSATFEQSIDILSLGLTMDW